VGFKKGGTGITVLEAGSISILSLLDVYQLIKRLTKPMMRFGSFNTARRTLSGIEAMSMIRKGQVNGIDQGNIVSQLKFIEALFGIVA
jgi:hypothetical protein